MLGLQKGRGKQSGIHTSPVQLVYCGASIVDTKCELLNMLIIKSGSSDLQISSPALQLTVMAGEVTPSSSLIAVTEMVYTCPSVTGWNWCLRACAPEAIETVVSPSSPSLSRPTERV